MRFHFIKSAFSIAILGLAVSASAKDDVPAETPRPHYGVAEALQGEIDLANSAKTPFEQHKAHHSLVRLFQDFSGRPSEERSQVCVELLKLPVQNLIMMEATVLDKSLGYLDGCRKQLEQVMEEQYEKDRQELQKLHGTIQHPDLTAVRKGDRKIAEDFCAGKIGNYPPIEVDPQGGHSYGWYTLMRSHPRISKPPGLAPKEIIMTLDDGPIPFKDRTAKALQTFEEHCVHATLFLIGQNLSTPAGQLLMKRELDGGHNIGNHTMTHPDDIKKMPHDLRIAEVERDAAAVDRSMEKFKKLTPESAHLYQATPFFRFPGGNEAVDVLDYLQQHNMPNFTWQAGADDWLPHMTAEKELQAALLQADQHQGGIMIMHEFHQQTVDMLPYLLDELTKRGYKIRHMIPKAVARGAPSAPSIPPTEPAGGEKQKADFTILKRTVKVRNLTLANASKITDESVLKLKNGISLATGDLKTVSVDGPDITIGEFTFKKVKIESVERGFEAFIGKTVYIWDRALQSTP